MLPYKKTGEFQNENNHLGTGSQSHMGTHFVHILFLKCKRRISGEERGHNCFSLLVKFNFTNCFGEPCYCRVISMMFPKGDLCPVPSAEVSLSRER